MRCGVLNLLLAIWTNHLLLRNRALSLQCPINQRPSSFPYPGLLPPRRLVSGAGACTAAIAMQSFSVCG